MRFALFLTLFLLAFPLAALQYGPTLEDLGIAPADRASRTAYDDDAKALYEAMKSCGGREQAEAMEYFALLSRDYSGAAVYPEAHEQAMAILEKLESAWTARNDKITRMRETQAKNIEKRQAAAQRKGGKADASAAKADARYKEQSQEWTKEWRAKKLELRKTNRTWFTPALDNGYELQEALKVLKQQKQLLSQLDMGAAGKASEMIANFWKQMDAKDYDGAVATMSDLRKLGNHVIAWEFLEPLYEELGEQRGGKLVADRIERSNAREERRDLKFEESRQRTATRYSEEEERFHKRQEEVRNMKDEDLDKPDESGTVWRRGDNEDAGYSADDLPAGMMDDEEEEEETDEEAAEKEGEAEPEASAASDEKDAEAGSEKTDKTKKKKKSSKSKRSAKKS